MSDAFDSKVAVLTGAARGIGYNVAKALVAKGSKVVIGDLLDTEGNAAVKELNDKAGKQVAAYVHCDVTKYKDLLALFDTAKAVFGDIDIAVLNAGIAGKLGAGVFTPLDDKADMLLQEINVGGVIKGSKVALLHMTKSGKGGVIVNTASVAGLAASPGLGAYSASKYAVVGWTRALVHLKELCNIRVNAVCPFFCQTDIIPEARDDAFSRFLQAVPKTSMESVVSAFLRCIEDTTLAGDTLQALPDGVHYVAPYQLQESCFSPEFNQQYPELQAAGAIEAKQQLEDAIKLANL